MRHGSALLHLIKAMIHFSYATQSTVHLAAEDTKRTVTLFSFSTHTVHCFELTVRELDASTCTLSFPNP